jgi:hypothetical protein
MTFESYTDFFNFLKGDEKIMKDSPVLRDFFNDCQLVFTSVCCQGKKGKIMTRAREKYSNLELQLEQETIELLKSKFEGEIIFKTDNEEVGRI